MAIKVTGLFKNPSTNAIFENPLLVIVPHLLPYGKIQVDVNIIDDNNTQMGAFPYEVDRESIIYPENITDTHDRLIKAIQNKLIAELPKTNNINQNANYESFKPTSETFV